MFVSLGPLRLLNTVANEAQTRRLKGRWDTRTRDTIQGMDPAAVTRIGASEWHQASKLQHACLFAYQYNEIAVPVTRLDLSNSKIEMEVAVTM